MRVLPALLLAICVPTVSRADEGEDRAVATVLGKPVLLKNVTPANVSKKREELKPVEFEEWLRGHRANLMLYAISGPVMRDYAVREKLKPTNEEIKETISAIVKEHIPVDELTVEESKKIGIRVFWLTGTSREWRDAKALYAKYGGRVGTSSFGGCTSIDGLNAVLRKYEKQGDLRFHDEELKGAFWEKVNGAPFTDVVLRPERVKQHFETPPWERWRRELVAAEIEKAGDSRQRED